MSRFAAPGDGGVTGSPLPPVPSGPPTVAPAGWYPDPHSPRILRYWDGVTWTEHRAPEYGAAPSHVPVVHATPAGPEVHGQRIVDPWARLGAYLVDGALMLVTLYVGWLIWACITAPHGQSPGKRLLGQRVIRLDTGAPATFAQMLFLRGVVAGTVFGLSFYVLAGLVLMFMPFWDAKNQTLIDKISGTVVVDAR